MKNKKIKKIKNRLRTGFTLLEVLIVIGIIAVLSAAVLVAINPTRQFKMARDTQRVSNVAAIANAISQNMSENKGVFKCEGVVMVIPNVATNISDSDQDIAPCLVPDYISSLPFDPNATDAHYDDVDEYDAKYKVHTNADGRIVVSAVGEIEADIYSIR